MKIATRLVYEEAVKLIESGKVAEYADAAANVALVFLGVAAAAGIALALIAWRDRNTRGKRLSDWVYTVDIAVIGLSMLVSLAAFACHLSFSDSPLTSAVATVTGDIEDNIDDPGYMYELGME